MGWGGVQGVADSPDFVQAHGLFPAFNAAHVGAVEFGELCKVLL